MRRTSVPRRDPPTQPGLAPVRFEIADGVNQDPGAGDQVLHTDARPLLQLGRFGGNDSDRRRR